MKVRFLYGPKAGTEEHISPKDAQPLITAGLAEAIGKPASEVGRLPKPGDAVVPQPYFTVEIIEDQLHEHKTLAVVMRIAGRETAYFGDPKKINDRVTWNGGGRWLSGFGRECPKEIVEQYKRQWKANEHLRGVVFCEPEGLGSPANEAMKDKLAAANRQVAAGAVPHSDPRSWE